MTCSTIRYHNGCTRPSEQQQRRSKALDDTVRNTPDNKSDFLERSGVSAYTTNTVRPNDYRTTRQRTYTTNSRSITFLLLWASALIGSVAAEARARAPGGMENLHGRTPRWVAVPFAFGGVRGTLTKIKMVVVVVVVLKASGRYNLFSSSCFVV